MNAKDDSDWPSLPPIRTSSYNARVSCETLTLHPSPTSSHPHTTSNTPSSTSHAAKTRPTKSASADASPLGTSSQTSHIFSSCFPHRLTKGHTHDGGKRGGFDAGALFRSMFGPVAPRYTTNMSAFASPPPSRATPPPPSISNSPSGRMKAHGGGASPINPMRSGSSTPHSGVVLRTSKGHAGHAFTMMPPDVVGKKKPPNYESDEPKSPEVTCIGKVRRKHCKATWDALVKEKRVDGKKKKDKVKRLSGDMTPMSGEILRKTADCEKKIDCNESTAAAKLSKQRSRRRHSGDFECFSTSDLDVCARKEVDFAGGAHHQDGFTKDAPRGSIDGVGDNSISYASNTEDFDAYKMPTTQGDEASLRNDATVAPPPPNCLLLMKKGSRNRSAHYLPNVDIVGDQGHQWNWGQVLT